MIEATLHIDDSIDRPKNFDLFVALLQEARRQRTFGQNCSEGKVVLAAAEDVLRLSVVSFGAAETGDGGFGEGDGVAVSSFVLAVGSGILLELLADNENTNSVDFDILRSNDAELSFDSVSREEAVARKSRLADLNVISHF